MGFFKNMAEDARTISDWQRNKRRRDSKLAEMEKARRTITERKCDLVLKINVVILIASIAIGCIAMRIGRHAMTLPTSMIAWLILSTPACLAIRFLCGIKRKLYRLMHRDQERYMEEKWTRGCGQETPYRPKPQPMHIKYDPMAAWGKVMDEIREDAR